MRALPPALLSLGLLAGCAGNIADHIGPRSGIVAAQLLRYDFDLRQSRCVAERLGVALEPLQLRRLERAASSVTKGYYDPDRLTPRDFLYVATTMKDAAVPEALTRAGDACGMAEALAGETETAPAPVAVAPEPPPATTAGSAPAPADTWLNLGSAPTGQSIAVDASTIERKADTRKAWFRLTNPGAAAPTGVTYLLGVDCAARTIDPIAHRVVDAAGAVTEYEEYPADEDDAMPAEGGTVMEIAYLAMCT